MKAVLDADTVFDRSSTRVLLGLIDHGQRCDGADIGTTAIMPTGHNRNDTC